MVSTLIRVSGFFVSVFDFIYCSFCFIHQETELLAGLIRRVSGFSVYPSVCSFLPFFTFKAAGETLAIYIIMNKIN